AVHPEALAVLDAQGKLTYAELRDRVNALAAYLLRMEIHPEDRIGIFLPRSANAVVAILGVLKAGAAYVPLHINDPKPRLMHIVRDARVRLVITHSSVSERMPDEIEDLLLIDLEPELMDL